MCIGSVSRTRPVSNVKADLEFSGCAYLLTKINPGNFGWKVTGTFNFQKSLVEI